MEKLTSNPNNLDLVEAKPPNTSYLVQRSRLVGQVRVSGAKNSVLRLLAASLLTSETVCLENYPASLLDAQVQAGMLQKLGKNCQITANKITIAEPESITSTLNWQGRSIRNTLLILGALVARTGSGSVPLPGGCQIGNPGNSSNISNSKSEQVDDRDRPQPVVGNGDRKFDLHEMLLRQMGAEVWIENNQLCAAVKDKYHGKLQGSDIHLPIRSTGATENAIICGSLATGITRVWNPHIRPEILDLINYLRSMGAKIQVFGQEHIEITGVAGLKGTNYRVLADNMEAITWLVGAVITGGDLEIQDFPYGNLEIPLIHLRESGTKFYRGDHSLIVRGGRCYPVEIATGPYPGINSDMQPLFAVYGAIARGESKIIDLRFPGRYGYAQELAKMGVQFAIDGNLLKIQGGHALAGAMVKALDLRAGVALTLAGLVAAGETRVSNSWQVERGYDNFVSKAQSLGARLQRYIEY
ncbi:UDP-N-acetylglucosamine 1-carboxyvinyltransferase [Thalassoporum mexicanum PCC 7367]|uniref:UDP-N-acetylglucosamine 1-carboxyvinyltransferase n=1 Tax=Thalassoporum mexicanum TaxID=3457544 RepID=UPI00029F9A7D|nr:UDP-N-acetylglucosamine 1-carboxyvinyltransferase [Pseudanabaena sp. PCC 7367]AFY69423.1 UDP-N-acetylglucosamine 1-carboxyvinyltransferase [Pseudanabaena sp. PCC 7367]